MTRKANILVAEDNEIYAHFVQAVLDRLDYECVIDTAANGFEAVEKIIRNGEHRSTAYDLVITDLNMPFFSGYDVAENAKMQRGANHTAVIIMSSEDRSDVEDKAYEAGADVFIEKSASMWDFTDIVNSAIATLLVGKGEDIQKAAK